MAERYDLITFRYEYSPNSDYSDPHTDIRLEFRSEATEGALFRTNISSVLTKHYDSTTQDWANTNAMYLENIDATTNAVYGITGGTGAVGLIVGPAEHALLPAATDPDYVEGVGEAAGVGAECDLLVFLSGNRS